MDNCFLLFADSHFRRDRLVSLLTRWVSAFAYASIDNSLMPPPTKPCS
jgi:hypothetical protein